MGSPIRQAKRQSEFLRTLLQRHRKKLLGRIPFGWRTITRLRGYGDHRGFRFAPMQLVIAVSDSGRIRRLDGWKPPQKPFRVSVKKADLVPEKIVQEPDRHRTGANPLHVKPVGQYGLWSMEAEHVRRVAEFLAGRHVKRTADSSSSVPRREAAATLRKYEKIRKRHPDETPSCKPGSIHSRRGDRELPSCERRTSRFLIPECLLVAHA